MTTSHTANDGPSRELDARVAEVLGRTSIYSAEPCGDDWCGRTRDGLHAHVPHYTTDPDDTAPVAELLAWLLQHGTAGLTIGMYDSRWRAREYGQAIRYADGTSLKHAVALLVLEVARWETK